MIHSTENAKRVKMAKPSVLVSPAKNAYRQSVVSIWDLGASEVVASLLTTFTKTS
jgi:hypothetical protein